MSPVPRTLQEFHRMFPNEASCAVWLMNLRWPDGNPCGCPAPLLSFYEGGRVAYCKSCRRKVRLTAGTIMDRSHTPLLTWFYAAFLMTTLTPGISGTQLSRQLGLPYETAYQILHKLRAGMVNPSREKLHGVVEADETYVAGTQHGNPGGRGTGDHRTVVLGVVEVRETSIKRAAGRVRLRVVTDASAASIDPFLRAHVESGTTIKTDGWSGYTHVRSMGYEHDRVVQGTPANAAHYLPVIHREFSNLKTWLQGTHHGRVERQHLQAYLNEFCFRHNRRKYHFDGFRRVFQIGSLRRSATYDELYNADEYGRGVHLEDTVPDPSEDDTIR